MDRLLMEDTSSGDDNDNEERHHQKAVVTITGTSPSSIALTSFLDISTNLTPSTSTTSVWLQQIHQEEQDKELKSQHSFYSSSDSSSLDLIDVSLPRHQQDDSLYHEENIDDDIPDNDCLLQDLMDVSEGRLLELTILLDRSRSGVATPQECTRLQTIYQELGDEKKELFLRVEEAAHNARIARRRIKEREIQRSVLAVAAAESVDVCFLVDCSSSTARTVRCLQETIHEIVTALLSTNEYLQINFSVIGYREWGGMPHFTTMDFTSSLYQLETFCQALLEFQDNNADPAETSRFDLGSIFKEANKLSWIHPSRICFFLNENWDKLCPSEGGDDDTFPLTSLSIDARVELLKLSRNHNPGGTMKLVFSKCPQTSNPCTRRIRLDQDTSIPLSLTSFDFECANSFRLIVSNAIRRCIFQTLCRSTVHEYSFPLPGLSLPSSLSTGSFLSPEHAEYAPPSTKKRRLLAYSELQTIRPKLATVYRSAKVRSLGELILPLSWTTFDYVVPCKKKAMKETPVYMRHALTPFGSDAHSSSSCTPNKVIAFHGQVALDERDLNDEQSQVVLKSFISNQEMIVYGKKDYLASMELNEVARFLAKQYNKTKRPSHCAKIIFLKQRVLECKTLDKEDEYEYFSMESLLPNGASEVVKYSSNTGYWDQAMLDESLLRFAIFTFEVTKGYLMISSLEGAKKENTYYLSNPSVLCSDELRFGRKNLGEGIIKRCLRSAYAHLEENGWDAEQEN